MKPVRRCLHVLYVGFALLSACSAWKDKPPPAPPPPQSRYERAQLDELLRYGEELIGMSAEERTAECARVLDMVGLNSALATRLHLLQLQLLTSKCGDHRQNLEALAQTRIEISDDSVRRWAVFHEQVLHRLEAESEQGKTLEKQLKQTRETVQQSRKQVKTRESELKNLKNKLDALKSIEEDLGSSVGERKP